MDDVIDTILKKNMGYKEGESILIITDPIKRHIADKFIVSGYDIRLLEIPPLEDNGQEPPSAIRDAMQKADIILLITDKSLSHTDARRFASKNRARIASMPGITSDMIERMKGLDYEKLVSDSKKIAGYLRKGSSVRIKTQKGTDLTMKISEGDVDEDTGLYIKPGNFGNLPAGEVCLAPIVGSTDGLLVIDESIPEKKIKGLLKITIKEGLAIFFDGEESEALKKRLGKVGKNGFNVAELGIGLNRNAIITGKTLEDEKVYGTAHIAFGNNVSFGGKVDVPIHLDLVFSHPDIYIDDILVIKGGEIL